MNQYIDVKRITDTLYLEDQTKVVIEFPVHSDQLSILNRGVKSKHAHLHIFSIFQKLIMYRSQDLK